MWLRIHTWYIGLKPLFQLLILFVINAIFWFAASEFYLWYFNAPPETLLHKIVFATWMSFVLTIPLNLKRWKLIFKKSSNEK